MIVSVFYELGGFLMKKVTIGFSSIIFGWYFGRVRADRSKMTGAFRRRIILL